MYIFISPSFISPSSKTYFHSEIRCGYGNSEKFPPRICSQPLPPSDCRVLDKRHSNGQTFEAGKKKP